MADNTKQEILNEATNLLSIVNNKVPLAMDILEKQLNVLQSRSQLLMSLAGVILTITGFSGGRIAGTSLFAKVCIISGLSLVLISAIWIWLKVLSIKWITGGLGKKPEMVLSDIIAIRDAKTRAYRIGGLILCSGLVIYSIAFAKMLIAAIN